MNYSQYNTDPEISQALPTSLPSIQVCNTGNTKFVSTSRGNPCPVCDRTDGSCRLKNDIILCHGHEGTAKDSVINGYRCLKESNGHTATFKKDNRGSNYTASTHADKRIKRDKSQAERTANKEAWEADKKHKAEIEAELKQARLAREMPLSVRDLVFNTVLDELSLKSEHKDYLIGKRGYTEEQIEHLKFKSVSRYFKPSIELPSNLPGLIPVGSGSNGGCLNISTEDGILIPGRADGQITNLYVHDRINSSGTGKYKPVSYQNNFRINDEPPVSSHFPEGNHKRVYLPEGGGYKSNIAGLKHDIPIIAATGGQFASSPINTRERIEKAVETYGKVTLALVPDAGDCLNAGIVTRIERQVDFLRSLGYEVEITWWNQIKKKTDLDIDELVSLEGVNYIQPEMFYSLAAIALCEAQKEFAQQEDEAKKRKCKLEPAQGFEPISSNVVASTIESYEAKVEEAIANSNLPENEKTELLNQVEEVKADNNLVTRLSDVFSDIAKKRFEHKPLVRTRKELAWIDRRNLTPTLKIDEKVFNFPSALLHDELASDQIWGIRSYLGSQKTQAIIKFMYKYRKHGFVLLGYRNNLLWQTIQRAFDYAKEIGLMEDPIIITHISKDDEDVKNVHTSSNPDSHIACCIDSMHKIHDYTGRVIIIDELVGVLAHATNGGTLGDNQPRCLAVFTKAIKQARLVIGLDANLTNDHINHLKELSDNTKEVINIVNTAKMKKQKFTIIKGIYIDPSEQENPRDNDKSGMFEMIDDSIKFGEKLFIACDSKKMTMRLHEILTTHKGRKVLTINSETVNEELQKEFLRNPDASIKKHKWDAVIISPSAEAGVSIDGKYCLNDEKIINELEEIYSQIDRVNGTSYFGAKFTFFCGVLSTNSQLQMLFRLRDGDIPHYIHCPEQSNLRAKDRATPFTLCKEEFIRALIASWENSARILMEGSVKTNEILRMVANALSNDQKKWLEFSAQQGVIDYYEQENYLQCLIHGLEEEMGHDVRIYEKWITNFGLRWSADVKAQDEIINQRHAKELFETVPFENVEDARKANKRSPKKDMQRKIERTLIQERLTGLESNEILSQEFFKVLVDEPYYEIQVRSNILIDRPEILAKHNEKNCHFLLTQNDYYIGTGLGKKDAIWALREAGIHTLRGMEYHQWTPEIKTIIETIKARNDIQIALKVQARIKTVKAEKDYMKFIGEMLEKLGYEQKKIAERLTEGSEGKVGKLKHYKAIPIDYKIKVNGNELSVRAFLDEAIAKSEESWMLSEQSPDWTIAPNISIDEQKRMLELQKEKYPERYADFDSEVDEFCKPANIPSPLKNIEIILPDKTDTLTEYEDLINLAAETDDEKLFRDMIEALPISFPSISIPDFIDNRLSLGTKMKVHRWTNNKYAKAKDYQAEIIK